MKGAHSDDEFSIKNIDEYSRVRVVYDEGVDTDSKRKLLLLSDKNTKVLPTKYENVHQLKEYIKEPDSLLLLMMSYEPENLEREVAGQNYMVVKRRRMRMIVPMKADPYIQGLETFL